MSQLIALIIAIALGAIVTAIGYVFLGDAFTQNSERGVALQFVNQASQLEMAMIAYRAENAITAYDTDLATTLVDATNTDGLVDDGFLKGGFVAPQGDYALVLTGSDVHLSVTAAITVLSNAVCSEIEELAGRNGDVVVATDIAAATAALDTRYGCFGDNATPVNNMFVYEVE